MTLAAATAFESGQTCHTTCLKSVTPAAVTPATMMPATGTPAAATFLAEAPGVSYDMPGVCDSYYRDFCYYDACCHDSGYLNSPASRCHMTCVKTVTPAAVTPAAMTPAAATPAAAILLQCWPGVSCNMSQSSGTKRYMQNPYAS